MLFSEDGTTIDKAYSLVVDAYYPEKQATPWGQMVEGYPPSSSRSSASSAASCAASSAFFRLTSR